MTVSTEAVARILQEVAAEEVLPRFRALGDADIRTKGGGEPVTVADEAAEIALGARLIDALPGSRVIGEEAVAGDPALLEGLASDEAVWIVDPIDGTANFARGSPIFAIMVALARRGETVGAWIHDPVGGRTAIAERGGGAWIDGRRLAVAQGAPALEMRGTLHAGTFAKPEMARQVQARRDRVGAIKSLRCAGHEYLRMAGGEMHFALFTRLMPWDHAPGTLIHREAGGVARTLDGTSYQPRSYRKPGLLMAPDEGSWETLRAALFDAVDAPAN